MWLVTSEETFPKLWSFANLPTSHSLHGTINLLPISPLSLQLLSIMVQFIPEGLPFIVTGEERNQDFSGADRALQIKAKPAAGYAADFDPAVIFEIDEVRYFCSELLQTKF